MSARGRPVTFRPPTRAPQGMTHEEALHLLALKPTYSPDIIRQAFANACKVSHPDTAETLESNQVSMSQLKEARDVLLEAAAGLGRACKLCRGVGQVRGAIGVRKCSACNGTGDKQ